MGSLSKWLSVALVAFALSACSHRDWEPDTKSAKSPRVCDTAVSHAHGFDKERTAANANAALEHQIRDLRSFLLKPGYHRTRIVDRKTTCGVSLDLGRVSEFQCIAKVAMCAQ